MSLTIERMIRVRTGEHLTHDLTEAEAVELARGLLAALGPAALAPAAPPALAATAGDVPVYGDWDADEPRLRALFAEGVKVADIARALNRSETAVGARIRRLDLHRPRPERSSPSGRRPPPAPPTRRAVPPPAAPPAAPEPEPEPPGPSAEGPAGPPWSLADTKALIRAFTQGTGLHDAAARTDRPRTQCFARWTDLKARGIATIDQYLASAEGIAATARHDRGAA